jgi:hypothetical protein
MTEFTQEELDLAAEIGDTGNPADYLFSVGEYQGIVVVCIVPVQFWTENNCMCHDHLVMLDPLLEANGFGCLMEGQYEPINQSATVQDVTTVLQNLGLQYSTVFNTFLTTSLVEP